MNVLHVLGNLTRDPELRRIGENDVAVVDVGIAVTTKFRNKNGEKLEDTAFLDCEAWDSGAETIANYFQKGDPILIEGRIKTDSWVTDDGDKRSKQKVRINKFFFIPKFPYVAKDERDGNEATAAEDDE